MERENIIELDGRRFKLGKVSALVGSNIIRRFTASGTEQIALFMGSLNDVQFASIQRDCLLTVSEIVEDKSVPVMMADGRVAVDVGSDLLYGLTFASLMFQLQDFFVGNALKDFETVIQSLKSVSA